MVSDLTPDDLAHAVLAGEDMARYLEGLGRRARIEAEARIGAYLHELRTTQRYPIYRALRHPLYPILRKVERRAEHMANAQAATCRGRVVYVSNHRSHLDYLIEPYVLDEHGIRPPVVAAGANLFGGPLGLLHRHVTGAVPIRRHARDPAYLLTLKAYIAELLCRHDLLFYPEGGRSYSGELKPLRTGLLGAVLRAERSELAIVPMAIAYDLVLEDRILARQGVKRRQRPFSREVAQMVRHAVGYRSRAFVTFGTPVSLKGLDPESRRDLVRLARRLREAIGRLHKVLPAALIAAAMRPGIARAELEGRVDQMISRLRAAGANLAVETGREAVEEGTDLLAGRGILAVERGRLRVRDRTVLRYYSRSLQHQLGWAAQPR